MKFSREFAMPSANTFTVAPIRAFVMRHLKGISIDPFARNSRLATHTNDLNPKTAALYHLDALAFLALMKLQGVQADTFIFDPPYSPRQIQECYSDAGITVGMKDTQSSVLYREVRKAAFDVLKPHAKALCFGWNSTGMGRFWNTEEILMVAHRGAHNDTICVAQTRPATLFDDSTNQTLETER